ncbi:MAG: amino acid--tRNA ligase-related protein, partial [Planctomycetia bacterium]
MTETGAFASAVAGLPPAERVTYREAFRRHAGFDPFHETDVGLTRRAEAVGYAPDAAATRDDLLNVLLAVEVEPKLGAEAPVFLHDYPASQAALARTRVDSDGATVAARFELYFRGVELANGYFELLDADVLASRNIDADRRRAALGKPPLPLDSRLLAAMRAGLPDCAGVALGFDRLVMAALNTPNLSDVVAFPWLRA